MSVNSSDVTSFGRMILRKSFCLDEDSAHCNHGGIGTVPKNILTEQIRMMERRERNPELWVRYRYEDLYMKAVSSVADFVGSKPENLVLLENASSATNAVLKSLNWNPGDKILVNDHSYGAVQKLAKFMADQITGVEKIVFSLPVPIRDESEIVNSLQKAIELNPGVRIAILDHITSSTAVLMPIQRMIEVCHQNGIIVFVDGAHAPGQVELNVESLGADYYTGNLHKWLFTPRGCAFLWIHPKHIKSTHPLVTTHYQYNPRIQDRFCLQATRDDIPYLLAPAAIEFYQSQLGGLEKIMSYVSPLIEWAADMLSEAWGTPNFGIPSHMRAPCMALIGLPPCDKYVVPPVGEWNRQLMNDLREKYNVYIFIPSFGGKIWCRISCQVYNAEEDYYRLRDSVKDLMGVNQATPSKRIMQNEREISSDELNQEDKENLQSPILTNEASDNNMKGSATGEDSRMIHGGEKCHKDSKCTIEMADGVSRIESDVVNQFDKSESNAPSLVKQTRSNDASLDDLESLNAKPGALKLMCCSP